MKALFVHDHKFSIDKDGNVYSHLMDKKLWKRYLEFFDELTVIGRSQLVDADNPAQMSGLRHAGCDNVDFCLIGKCWGENGDIKDAPSLKQKYDIIKQQIAQADKIIVRLPSVFGIIACREAKKQGKKYAVEIVACAWDSNFYYGNIKNKSAALPFYTLMKRCIKSADAAIYVTDSFLQQRYPCTGYCGIASNVYLTRPDKSVIDRRLEKIDSLDRNSVIKFGLVGSLNVNFKGHSTAISALAMAKDSIPDFELHCIGLGEKDRWQKFANELGIGDKMRFDGLLKSGKPVQEWMDGLDVLLIPSLQEGLPRALIEAMSRGLPALGAVTGGIPQLLEDRFLHKKKDYKKLSGDIISLVNDKALMKKCCVDNYNAVKRYESDILEKDRSRFWKRFYEM